jgi:hypothetical protein
MKKTVTLTSLIKAKNDLELFIKIDQMKRLKKLFDPSFDLKDVNSKIETKEDQLIIIKLAIDEGNRTLDENGNSIHYSIYQLSKHNRLKADLLTLQRRFESSDLINNNDKLKSSLLNDIKDLDTLMEKEEDKKKKADFLSSKNKLKRSLSKVTKNDTSETTKLQKEVVEELSKVEKTISTIKDTLTKLNGKTTVEVDILDEFEIVIK